MGFLFSARNGLHIEEHLLMRLLSEYMLHCLIALNGLKWAELCPMYVSDAMIPGSLWKCVTDNLPASYLSSLRLLSQLRE